MNLTGKFSVVSSNRLHVSDYLSPGMGKGKKGHFADDGNVLYLGSSGGRLSKLFKVYI